MAKKRNPKGRKVRVDFRQNREAPRRRDDITRQYRDQTDRAIDHATSESVRAKGGLSRKRTIIVGGEEASQADGTALPEGLILSTHGLLSHVQDDAGRLWHCTVRRIVRTRLIAQRSGVTTGDRVGFRPVDAAAEPPVGVIERVRERRSVLSRRDRRGREHAIVANADQLLIVSSVFEPMVKPHLIDRYIVAALKGGLTPLIALNKIDLYAGAEAEDATEGTEGTEDNEGAEEDQRHAVGRDIDDDAESDDFDEAPGLTVESLVAEFISLGYRCLCTSAETGVSIDELREALAGRITVVSGQSGVGKSSLINAMQPGLNIETRAVSESTEKGQHTTTHARLHPLAVGGYLVDTPGIRAFELWAVEPPELESYFVEFLPHLDRCRYRDCLHLDEEGCAVREAMQRGAISERRYMSYVKMYLDAGDAVRRERGQGR
jgi:ribosome biogenesis GTPase